MDRRELEELRTAGATARVQGCSIYHNPYLSFAAMPAATGESIDHWRERHDAWKTGWEMQDAMFAERHLDELAKWRDTA